MQPHRYPLASTVLLPSLQPIFAQRSARKNTKGDATNIERQLTNANYFDPVPTVLRTHQRSGTNRPFAALHSRAMEHENKMTNRTNRYARVHYVECNERGNCAENHLSRPQIDWQALTSAVSPVTRSMYFARAKMALFIYVGWFRCGYANLNTL